ncbi:hypothetical protein [Dyadobacter sp. CY343]|uniref:hypothetical protein n=1 Tax=Dyadobacter sp. CY343 TaxID=2907299 RepID=UPI001F31AFE7|nr:hypothetical protein [Dyadobacter sp. CY343]MCE7062984.1 hypothetical protein [Dyadobacter sp. CY343]
MQHTFQVRTSELGTSFIKSVKSVFGNREVKITVETVSAAQVTPAQSDVARFLQHRKDHPAIRIEDQRDFNEVIDDLEQ